MPVFAVNAFDKQVGIKSRFADKGQYFAGLGIQRHQRAAAIAKKLFDQMLQPDVNGELDGIAGCRRTAGEFAHGAPAGRCLYRFDAGGAVQLRLETLFDAEFAYVLGAPVIGLLLGLVKLLLFGRVDAPDITNDMAGQLAVRVVAEQSRLDFDAGEAKTLRSKLGHLLVAEPGAQWQRLKAF